MKMIDDRIDELYEIRIDSFFLDTDEHNDRNIHDEEHCHNVDIENLCK